MRRIVPVVVALVLACCGCVTLWKAGIRPSDGGRMCAGELVPTAAIPDGFALRAEVRVLAKPGIDWALTVAAQKTAGRLVVVGLDGFGAKLFTIVQQDTSLTVDRAFGRSMPWPPENVLRDIQVARLGATPGQGVSIERSAEEGGRVRVVIHDGSCDHVTIVVLAGDEAAR